MAKKEKQYHKIYEESHPDSNPPIPFWSAQQFLVYLSKYTLCISKCMYFSFHTVVS